MYVRVLGGVEVPANVSAVIQGGSQPMYLRVSGGVPANVRAVNSVVLVLANIRGGLRCDGDASQCTWRCQEGWWCQPMYVRLSGGG